MRSISCTADAELPCQCNRLLITWRYSRRMTTQTPTFSLALLVQNEPLRNCDSLNRRLRKIDRHEDVLNAQLFHGDKMNCCVKAGMSLLVKSQSFLAPTKTVVRTSRDVARRNLSEADRHRLHRLVRRRRAHLQASLHISGYQRRSSISIRSKSVSTLPSFLKPCFLIISGMNPSVSSSCQPRLLIKLL